MADAASIKELREKTGLSFDKIRKALGEAGDDQARALELLKSQAGDVAAGKASRGTTEGAIGSYVHTAGKIGAIVRLACETDFVARNNDFTTLVRDLAMHAAALQPQTPEEMLDQQFVKDPTSTVRDVINQAIAKLGENIQLTGVAVLMIG